MRRDLLKVRLKGQRSELGGIVERIADANASCPLRYPLEYFFVFLFLHEHA